MDQIRIPIVDDHSFFRKSLRQVMEMQSELDLEPPLGL